MYKKKQSIYQEEFAWQTSQIALKFFCVKVLMMKFL